jgi:hypothetical protein
VSETQTPETSAFHTGISDTGHLYDMVDRLFAELCEVTQLSPQESDALSPIITCSMSFAMGPTAHNIQEFAGRTLDQRIDAEFYLACATVDAYRRLGDA